MTGEHVDAGEGDAAGEGLTGQQAGGDEERLGDRSVLDGLGVGLGAVVDEVEPDDGCTPRFAVQLTEGTVSLLTAELAELGIDIPLPVAGPAARACA